MSDPFKGKPKSGEGNFTREIPSEDTHHARIVGLIDLGTHEESFQGEPAKPARKVMLAFELDEVDSQRQNFIVIKEYKLSFHEKAGLRLLAESVINDGKKFPDEDEIDYKALLGQPCQVQISHDASGERTFVKIKMISSMPKKQREQCFKPQRKPVSWFLGSDMKGIPGWLPYYFGKSIHDIIKESAEMAGGNGNSNGNGQHADDEGEVGAGVGTDDDSTPF